MAWVASLAKCVDGAELGGVLAGDRRS